MTLFWEPRASVVSVSLLSVSNLSFPASSLPSHRYVPSSLLLPNSPSSAWWPHKSPMFHIWRSGEGSRWRGCPFCHPGRQVEGQLELQQQVGRWGFRAEREGDTKSSTTLGQNSLPGTSPAGGRWQQLGAASAPEQAKNNLGWVTGSCCVYGWPPVAHHLMSLQWLHWSPQALWQRGFCPHVSLIQGNFSFLPSLPLPWPTPVPPLGFSFELSAQSSNKVPLSLCFHSSKLLANYTTSEFASVILFPHWVVTSLVTGTVSCPSLLFPGPRKVYLGLWIFVALSKSHLCSRYHLINYRLLVIIH